MTGDWPYAKMKREDVSGAGQAIMWTAHPAGRKDGSDPDENCGRRRYRRYRRGPVLVGRENNGTPEILEKERFATGLQMPPDEVMGKVTAILDLNRCRLPSGGDRYFLRRSAGLPRGDGGMPAEPAFMGPCAGLRYAGKPVSHTRQAAERRQRLRAGRVGNSALARGRRTRFFSTSSAPGWAPA